LPLLATGRHYPESPDESEGEMEKKGDRRRISRWDAESSPTEQPATGRRLGRQGMTDSGRTVISPRLK